MKALTFHAASAAMIMLILAAQAQTTLPASAEAVVRDGTNAGLDLNEASLGYCMVKYSTAGTSGKSYFKFDFAGHRPNTNANLGLVFTTFNNSQRQHVQVWSLNQAYPAFTSGALIWNTAQANDTAGNGMITNTASPFTAKPVVDFISPGGALTTRTVILPAPWGGLLVDDKLVLVLTSLNDPATNQNNGLRIQTNTTALVFPELIGQPP